MESITTTGNDSRDAGLDVRPRLEFLSFLSSVSFLWSVWSVWFIWSVWFFGFHCNDDQIHVDRL